MKIILNKVLLLSLLVTSCTDQSSKTPLDSTVNKELKVLDYEGDGKEIFNRLAKIERSVEDFMIGCSMGYEEVIISSEIGADNKELAKEAKGVIDLNLKKVKALDQIRAEFFENKQIAEEKLKLFCEQNGLKYPTGIRDLNVVFQLIKIDFCTDSLSGLRLILSDSKVN